QAQEPRPARAGRCFHWARSRSSIVGRVRALKDGGVGRLARDGWLETVGLHGLERFERERWASLQRGEEVGMGKAYHILSMGASYGPRLGTKLVAAGHSVKLICLPAEAELINGEGAFVRMPVKGRDGPVEIATRSLPGRLSAGGPAGVNPGEYDLVALA